MAGEHHDWSMVKSANPYHVGYDQSDEVRVGEDLKLHNDTNLTGTYLVKQPKVLVGVIPSGRDYMMWSILACIFCFMPTGVVALYYANKANNDLDSGSLLEAEHAQRQSRKFIVLSVLIGSVLLVVVSVVLGLLYSHGHI